MVQENYEAVQKGFRILHPLMADYIGMELSSKYRDDWWSEVLNALSDQRDLRFSGSYGELVDSLDVSNCLRLIDRRWREVFSMKLSIDFRTWSKELMGVRNTTAHIGSADLKQEYAERALDTMALLCEAFDAEGTEAIRKLYRKVRYGTEDGSMAAASVAPAPKKKTAGEGVLKSFLGAHLPSWRDVMQPHPDVAEGRYRLAEFAANLAQVARGEGSIEYRDPVEFFARTYVTEGMAGLLTESLMRLAGKGGEPVIQLKTAFGGGKTHSMLALYHLVRGLSVKDVPNLKGVLARTGFDTIPRAHVAVLVGTALEPAKWKNPPNLPGYTVNTLWGEMAYQLVTAAGKPNLYELVRDSDKRGVSPGSEALKKLFDACGPCLVLMDELVAYAKKLYGKDGLPAGSYDNFITFIQEITEAATASKNSLVVASIPESDIEIGGEAGRNALEAIEHTFGRMESIWKPVAADEGFEVVRRRLFLPCRDESAREAVCEAFSRMYQENASDFPAEAKELGYKERMLACYPIHPEIFERLYGDWATLARFQRTRGVLRLMAAVIHELWMGEDASAMIMPGSIPLNIPGVRDELVRHLPDAWNSIIDHEVDGKDSVPYQKDKETLRYGHKMAARRVARTVMLGSAPSTSALRDGSLRGLECTRIRLGVVQPGESIADFNDALNTLHGSLSYLYNNTSGNRYWYDTKPTLRKTSEDRAVQMTEEAVEEELVSRLKKLRREQPLAGLHACPASSLDIPDEQAVRLVLLCPEDTCKLSGGVHSGRALERVKEYLNTRGTSPRTYRNMLAFIAPDEDRLKDLKKEIRRYLAWLSIMKDAEELNLDAGQEREAKANRDRSEASVKQRIKETYSWLMIPGMELDEGKKEIEWEIVSLGGGSEEIVTKAVKRMRQNEDIIEKWAPMILKMHLDNVLWTNEDHIEVKRLWEYLSTYCYLPRLAGFPVLEDAIRMGLGSTEYFGLAGGMADGKYIDLTLGKVRYDINKSDLLVKPGVAARKLADKAAETSTSKGGEQGIVTGIVDNDGGHGNDNLPPKTEKKPRRFYMSAELDTARVNKNVQEYLTEIINHLSSLAGASVALTLEVSADIPQGAPPATVRTVTENCKTLGVRSFGFEEN